MLKAQIILTATHQAPFLIVHLLAEVMVASLGTSLSILLLCMFFLVVKDILYEKCHFPVTSTELSSESDVIRPSGLFGSGSHGSHPLLDGNVNCTVIEKMFLGKRVVEGMAGLRSLLPLCDSPVRHTISATVPTAYLETYARISNGSGIMDEAYVCFLRGNAFVELSTSALRAVHEFSSRPVMLFISGDQDADAETLWPPTSYPRLVVVRMATGPMKAYFDKLFAAVISPVIHGVIIEADTLITHHADRLFGILRRYGHQAFPLMPGHQDVRWDDCRSYRGPKCCGNPVSYPYAQRSMDYVHAHLMWTVESKPFLVDVLLKCSPGSIQNKIDCSHDEIALNYALWNAGATRQLCLMDPYKAYIDTWEKMDLKTMFRVYKNRTMGFLFIHGNKNATFAEDLVRRIALMKGKAWRIENGDWSISTDTYVHEDGCLL
jgi:hypothetical protein